MLRAEGWTGHLSQQPEGWTQWAGYDSTSVIGAFNGLAKHFEEITPFYIKDHAIPK